MLSIAAAGPTAFWYTTRATGFVSLILLTLSIVLGVMGARRDQPGGVQRFVLDAVHRNASLLAMAFLVVHIITSVLDGFAPITLLDSVVPFVSGYRPIWLGLGTVAFDLLIAIVITSLVRRRLGYGAWRAVHWLAYASWPVAVVHGLGTGSDTKTKWALFITAVCVVVVVVAVIARATAGWPAHREVRVGALSASAILPIALVAWLPSGPLGSGWARRAGTPASLLAATTTTRPVSNSSVSSRTSTGARVLSTSFTATVSGTSSQGQIDGGLDAVDLALTINGEQLSRLDLRIIGQPADGGVAMTSSQASLGTAASPRLYQGRITALQGTTIEASLTNASGARLRVLAQLQLDPNGSAVTGSVTVSPRSGR
jgi:hypothetical protein